MNKLHITTFRDRVKRAITADIRHAVNFYTMATNKPNESYWEKDQRDPNII